MYAFFFSGNAGLFERNQVTKGSKLFDLVGLPLNDCLQLDRYMINGIHLRLVLFRNSAEFCLVSPEENIQNGNYKIQIEDAFLRLCKVQIHPGILLAHSKMIKQVSCKYPYTRTEIKCASIPSGQNAFNWDNINSSYLPKFVLVTLVESVAVLGDIRSNPYMFANFDVKQVNVCVNGVPCPGSPVNVNYDPNNGVNVMELFDRLYASKEVKSTSCHSVGGGLISED